MNQNREIWIKGLLGKVLINILNIYHLKVKVISKRIGIITKTLIYQDTFLLISFIYTIILAFQGLFNEDNIKLLNIIFTLIFLFEMLTKVFGLGFKGF